jgi:hypothetical protein
MKRDISDDLVGIYVVVTAFAMLLLSILTVRDDYLFYSSGQLKVIAAICQHSEAVVVGRSGKHVLETFNPECAKTCRPDAVLLVRHGEQCEWQTAKKTPTRITTTH